MGTFRELLFEGLYGQREQIGGSPTRNAQRTSDSSFRRGWLLQQGAHRCTLLFGQRVDGGRQSGNVQGNWLLGKSERVRAGYEVRYQLPLTGARSATAKHEAFEDDEQPPAELAFVRLERSQRRGRPFNEELVD